jgi:hypothetical protein
MNFEYRCYKFHTSLYKFYEDGRVEYFGIYQGEYCWKDGSDFNIDKNDYMKTTLNQYVTMNQNQSCKFLAKENFYDELLNSSDN